MTPSADSLAPRLVVAMRVAGLVSETFVRRHVEGLDPRGAAVISQKGLARPAAWGLPGSHLDLSELGFPPGSKAQALRSLGFSRPERLLSRAGRRKVESFLADEQVTAAISEYLDVSVALEPFLRQVDRRIFHAHGYDVSASLRHRVWRRAYRRLSRQDAIVVPSEHARDRLVQIGASGENILVVPYGVPGPARRRADLDDSEIRVLAVGRMVAKKAPLTLMRVLERGTRGASNVRVDVVGDGPLLKAVVNFVQERELAHVTVHGALPHTDVARLLQEAHLFVQHSVRDPATGDEEGMPVAILEAMAHGVPVVATRHAGIPEAVEDGVEGVLVAEGDVAGMASAVQTILGEPSERARMARAARRRWEREFRWEDNRRRLLELLSGR